MDKKKKKEENAATDFKILPKVRELRDFIEIFQYLFINEFYWIFFLKFCVSYFSSHTRLNRTGEY